MAGWTRFREEWTTKHPEVHAEVVEHDGHEWLQLSATVGSAANYKLYQMLRRNFDLEIGHFYRSGNDMLVSQALPLPTDDENVDAAVAALVENVEWVRGFFEAK